LHPKAVLVTLAGRINRWKGQGLLVEAVHLLKTMGAAHGARFLIVGDVAPGQEHLRAQLKEAIERYQLQEDVLVRGFVGDMAPIWAATQIAVVPSTDPEPFGMVAIEAMAASVAVVAAAHGGLLDIVGHGVTGLLFTPGDAMELANALKCLIEDEQLRSAFGRAGYERQVATFGLDAQVTATEAIYTRVIK
jgi:glycosyltransferase involved in cell wall biosynthesis